MSDLRFRCFSPRPLQGPRIMGTMGRSGFCPGGRRIFRARLSTGSLERGRSNRERCRGSAGGGRQITLISVDAGTDRRMLRRATWSAADRSSGVRRADRHRMEFHGMSKIRAIALLATGLAVLPAALGHADDIALNIASGLWEITATPKMTGAIPDNLTADQRAKMEAAMGKAMQPRTYKECLTRDKLESAFQQGQGPSCQKTVLANSATELQTQRAMLGCQGRASARCAYAGAHAPDAGGHGEYGGDQERQDHHDPQRPAGQMGRVGLRRRGCAPARELSRSCEGRRRGYRRRRLKPFALRL